MIEVNNISFNYAGSRTKVFNNFSMTIEQNSVYGLLGKNGTGKSTLLYLLCGLLRPTHGTILVDGIKSWQRRPEMLEELFIVPEEFNLPALSLERYVKEYSKFYPRFSQAVFNQCISDFELLGAHRLNELSMGQKKKIIMSFALATGVKLLLMDEPTNGLDIPSKSLFRKVVARNMSDESTLIISTHQVHDVESLLNHILILSENQLLLNASTSQITERYAFEYRQPSEMNENVIYAEPALQGNAVIAHRKQGQAETQLNLELLFTAVVNGLIKMEDNQ